MDRLPVRRSSRSSFDAGVFSQDHVTSSELNFPRRGSNGILKEFRKQRPNFNRRQSKTPAPKLQSLFVFSGLHLARIPTPDEVVRQSRILVRDYIYARLKKQGLLNHRRVDLEPSCKPSDVSYEIQYVGAELERMYPDLYKNVSRQLNVTMSSESIVRKTFTAVGEEILKDGRDNFTEATVTWGKVVALFATANAFAVDCVQQGHPEFVALVVDSFENLVSKNLVDWIVKQGGWPDIIRTFRTSRDATFLWALSGLGAVVGFILTLAATIHL